jgi:hypothetical protein
MYTRSFLSLPEKEHLSDGSVPSVALHQYPGWELLDEAQRDQQAVCDQVVGWWIVVGLMSCNQVEVVRLD